MAWTAFPTWVVGQVSTASDWNTYVAANGNFLATPPIARVYRNSALTATSSANTLMPYDTVSFDSVSGFSVSTHLYTVAVAGTYSLIVGLGWTSVADTTEYVAFTYHNGAQTNFIEATAGATVNAVAQCQDFIVCIVGDTLSGQYYISAADAFNVGGTSGCIMSILKVSN